MANKYYAVKVGRIPGIYQTWDETKEQINGYSGAVYKKFATYQEAKQFILDFEDCVYDKKEDTHTTELNDQIKKKLIIYLKMRSLHLLMVVIMLKKRKLDLVLSLLVRVERSTHHINLLENSSMKI